MAATLQEGSRVGVIGGGPAGALFAYFLLTSARRVGLHLGVDIYEPRDFSRPGPGGCNMCGGIVSDSVIHALASEGISLPPSVVQRVIDSYVLHTDLGSVRIRTSDQEAGMAAVHRGAGPSGVRALRWGGLDSHLLAAAEEAGAQVVTARVGGVGWDSDRPQVYVKGIPKSYDLLVGATGVNSPASQFFEPLGLRGQRAETTRAYITELNLGSGTINKHFGTSMHIFLLNMPRLHFAALIPKGEYVTVCLLGPEVDAELVDAFFASPAVSHCLPLHWDDLRSGCHCSPRINIREASKPFCDRVVLVGDCGVTRLYKDGIGAAYRTAKAAASTALLKGVSAEAFRADYWPTYHSIAHDNRFGQLIFAGVHRIKGVHPLVGGVLRMSAGEQSHFGSTRPMSTVLWDLFTGSAAYRDIFVRMLHPSFLGRLLWSSALVAAGSRPSAQQAAELTPLETNLRAGSRIVEESPAASAEPGPLK